MARLAAIVPPPRYPLLTYHGVLAPASRWRPLVVPRPRDGAGACEHSGGAERPEQRSRVQVPGCGHAHGDGGNGDSSSCTGARNPVPSSAVRGLDLLAPLAEPDENEYVAVLPVERWKQLGHGALLARSPRIDWPRLLRRTFREDVLACPRCRGRLEVLDVVAKPEEARRQLEELGIDVRSGSLGESATAGPSGSPRGADIAGGPRSRAPPARAPGGAPGACIRSSRNPTPRA